MILARKHILQNILNNRITCEPFNPDYVGPNSIDVHLGPIIKWVLPNMTYGSIDVRQPSRTREMELPKEGFTLEPGVLVLGLTVEAVGSAHYVPHMHGCSTLGRSGLVPHIEAGFGDVGFASQWTLEIMAMAWPVILYPGMRIAQIEFHEVSDDSYLYGRDCGRYAKQNEARGAEPEKTD